MNTKQKRVVATLFLALAAMATMGFSAAHEDSRRAASILPDHLTCELIEPSFAAIELLDLITDSCYSDMVERVEREIGWGFGGQSGVEALLDSIYERSRSIGSGSSEYLELIETESDWSSDSLNRPQDEPRVQFDDREMSPDKSIRPGYNYDSDFDLSELFKLEPLSKHVQPGYDYDSAFDLSELFEQESPSDLIRPGYNHDSAFDLSELSEQERLSKHVRPGYNYDSAYDLSELFE